MNRIKIASFVLREQHLRTPLIHFAQFYLVHFCTVGMGIYFHLRILRNNYNDDDINEFCLHSIGQRSTYEEARIIIRIKSTIWRTIIRVVALRSVDILRD